jgi:hypothetical protein
VDALIAEAGLVPVVEVVARDAPERFERGSGGACRGCGVDEQVPVVALEEEGADVQRGRERQGFRRGGVEVGERCVEHASKLGPLRPLTIRNWA